MTEQQSIKKQLAHAFKEPEKVDLYEALFVKHDETTIKNAFEDTKKVPLSKIKKSQSALFIFLLRKYA